MFEGVLNGSTITGTLKVDERGTATGGVGGPVSETGSGAYAITLTKS